MSNFKNDWRETTREEHMRYLVIILVILVMGSLGIYDALRFYLTQNEGYLLSAVIWGALCLGFMGTPWRNKTGGNR